AAHKLQMRRRLAAIWEGPLSNRYEALDVWKQVLREAPRDEEALAAIERLERASRRPDDDDDDLLSAPIVDDFGDAVGVVGKVDSGEHDGDGTATETEADDVDAASVAGEAPEELTNPSIVLPEAEPEAADVAAEVQAEPAEETVQAVEAELGAELEAADE